MRQVDPVPIRRVSPAQNARSGRRRTLLDGCWKRKAIGSRDIGAASGGGVVGGRLGQPKRQLTVGASHLVIAFIRLHDFLYQIVAYHVPLVELDEADTFDTAKHVDHLNQAASLPST